MGAPAAGAVAGAASGAAGLASKMAGSRGPSVEGDSSLPGTAKGTIGALMGKFGQEPQQHGGLWGQVSGMLGGGPQRNADGAWEYKGVAAPTGWEPPPFDPRQIMTFAGQGRSPGMPSGPHGFGQSPMRSLGDMMGYQQGGVGKGGGVPPQRQMASGSRMPMSQSSYGGR